MSADGPGAGAVARLALRLVRREWRAGELAVFAVALVIAVASITAVGFFTDRMQRAMERGASELLAADVLVRSSEPIDGRLAAEAARRGLDSARTLTFRSVVVHGDALELAEVKAVGPGYPLRGRLRTAADPFAAGDPVDATPERGGAWIEGRLASLLGVRLGDRVELGASRLRVTRFLAYEPDRGGELFNIAPRLMINLDDVPATGLVQPASRVTHRLLFAGAPEPVAAFRAWLDASVDAGERVQGIRDARPEMRAALERADQFLGLAALVSVLLAGVAIAVAARRHAERHLDAAAVMRCVGATQRTVLAVFALQAGAVGVVASAIGCAVGYAAQAVLARTLEGLVVGGLPAPSPLPVVQGIATGLVVLGGFALPPLVALRDVPPARTLRRELGPTPVGALGLYGAAAVAFVALVLWHARDATLAGWVLAGGAGTIVLLAVAARILVAALSPLRRRVGVAWRFGLANIARRARASVVQSVAFGLGITMLLLLTLVRGDLLREWRENVPEGAPNFFLVNIQPDEVERVDRFLDARGLASAALYPMVRGRLESIGGREVRPEDYASERARRLAAREFNLSWSAALPPDNRVVAGSWWGASGHGDAALSVEQGIAERLGFALGDALTFRVAGERVTATVASIRTVEWDSFRPNFFVLAPPELLRGYPATWITAFHLPRAERTVLAELVREFPSVTVIDVAALLEKIREIMDQASRGVEYVFGFTLLAGFVVLFAAIQSTLDERRYETAVVRTLGASRARLVRGLLAEFAALGLLAGGLAALAATLTGAVLADRVFGLAYHPDPRVWAIGLAGGCLGVAAAGWMGARAVLDQPPLQTLRGT